MLEEYYILVKRIEGLSLSPMEYWELDTFTTQKLLDLEKETMEREAAAYGKEKYKEFSDENSDDMMDIVQDMTE